MKYLVCPPCGTVFEGETEQEVVRLTLQHAKEKHDYDVPADEFAGTITSAPPRVREEE